jgi:nitrite reductase/ring-hydroxylating ferredoxin subunit
MHTRPRTPPPDADWAEALSLDRLHNDGPTATRLRGRQVALFAHGDQVFACNNRCPHEGYPLCEGHLAADGVLTCQWHNWKFDLASGANLYGGDALRTYPTRVVDGTVWVDLAEPPAEARIAQALARLDEARDDHDPPRIARELARLERAGGSAETALAHTIVATHERLRYGMTHAYAAAEAWLRLHDNLTAPGVRPTFLRRSKHRTKPARRRCCAEPSRPASASMRWSRPSPPLHSRITTTSAIR